MASDGADFPHFIAASDGVPDGYPHKWAYSGACRPDGPTIFQSGSETFSLGIYPVVPKSRGKGLKRGKVVERIRGCCDDFGDTCRKCEAWITETEADA